MQAVCTRVRDRGRVEVAGSRRPVLDVRRVCTGCLHLPRPFTWTAVTFPFPPACVVSATMESASLEEHVQQYNGPMQVEEEGVFVALTHDVLDAVAIMNRVRSPKAGAIVLFAGTPTQLF